MTSSKRIRVGALLVATTLVVAACGLRTPVRPPEDTAPVVPGTPTVTREADATVVRWRRAVRSADDERLDDLAAFVVERRSSQGEAWTPVGTIDVVDQEKIRRRKSFAWRDDAAPAEASYRVIAVTADGQQGPPNEAVAAVATPAEPPAPDPRSSGDEGSSTSRP